MSEHPDGSIDWDRQRFVQNEVFRNLHSLLTHASNISKLLWPASGRGDAAATRELRGKELRQYLGLSGDAHPLKKRTLRNHLEHFDERLDHWRETSEHMNFAQDNIGPWGSIVGIEESDVMRWYDPPARRFIFRGESYDIGALVAAIDALLPIASEAAERARRGGPMTVKANKRIIGVTLSPWDP